MVPKLFIIIAVILLVLVAGIIVLYISFKPADEVDKIDSFEKCMAAGFPIMESYPRQCRAGDKLFAEEIETDSEPIETENIRVSSLKTNEVIQSPLIIEGEARGLWFFEGVFPARLFDENEKEIAVGYVQTTDDWMTENFVPFYGQLEFKIPLTRRGTLVLERDNPSGLPEHHEEIRIPIIFATNDGDPAPITECKKTGCSGQVCSDEDIITTCEFLPEYLCYRTALCERQANRKCGWTMTEELTGCIEKARSQDLSGESPDLM